jgi:hypothetical protein
MTMIHEPRAGPYEFSAAYEPTTRRHQVLLVLVGMGSPILCHFILGALASLELRGQALGERFGHPTYLQFNLLWTLVFTPLSLAFYIWLPRSLATILNALTLRAHAVRSLDPASPARTLDDETRRLASAFRALWGSRLWLWAALGTVTCHSLYLWFRVWPRERQSLHPFWLESSWYRPFFLVGYATTLVVLWLFVIKGVLVVVLVAKWFRRFDIAVTPLHPDGVGGLAVVQQHVFRVLAFATFFGSLTWVYALRVLEIHSYGRPGASVWDVLLRADLAGMLLVYLLAAPVCAVLPMLHAHLRMVDARNRALGTISDEYNRVIADITLSGAARDVDFGGSTKRLTDLGQAHDTIHARYPVYPVRVPKLALGFAITYLPLVKFVLEMLPRVGITRS